MDFDGSKLVRYSYSKEIFHPLDCTRAKRTRLDGAKTESQNYRFVENLFFFSNPFRQLVVGCKIPRFNFDLITHSDMIYGIVSEKV